VTAVDVVMEIEEELLALLARSQALKVDAHACHPIPLLIGCQ
jgi:hypothetical protein